MATATMTTKGQITIPKEVREFLRVDSGDRLEFSLEEDGTVRVRRPRRSAQELYGILHQPGLPALRPEEMRQAVLDTVAEDDDRIRSSWKP